ncbi:MAG: sulfite exporter TauE/SafE family protein [Candidatus Kerfeldbacteria bacterium]|nr:sulfite exporter TauE/SafE family protein [Candidatus Kerfeldbacteria bacterium]
MTEQSLTHDRIRIRGMTCTSCEVIIERKLKQLPGVKRVTVNHATGWCKIEHDSTVPLYLSDIRTALQEHGYQLWSESATNNQQKQQHHWREFGVVLLILFVVYKVLQVFGVFSLSANVDASINLGAIFVIGLVAAVSTCTALVSGLILSVAAKYNETHQATTKWQRLKPHLLFNLGRLVSYFVLGGIIGLIGQAITPSTRFTGILTILISMVMILLGIDILKLFQGKRFIPKMPKWFSQKMYQLAESDRPWVPLMLGGLTFFLPCGFTQSMQLYALTTGSFWQGGLTMVVFALGTLPALLGVGMLASFAKGNFARYFMKFSGAMVLVLGLYNFNNGLALADIQPANWFSSGASVSDGAASVTITGDKQVVSMAVEGISYSPATITIKQGVPVEWHIDGSNAQGCAQIITIPSLGITKQLSATTDNVITFTPTQTGRINFSCTMGMARGSFIVAS